MTDEEAEARAKELFGSRAYVKHAKNGLLDIMLKDQERPDMPYLLGWGKTWEEALALAEIRAEWHPKPEHEEIKPQQLELWSTK